MMSYRRLCQGYMEVECRHGVPDREDFIFTRTHTPRHHWTYLEVGEDFPHGHEMGVDGRCRKSQPAGQREDEDQRGGICKLLEWALPSLDRGPQDCLLPS